MTWEQILCALFAAVLATLFLISWDECVCDPDDDEPCANCSETNRKEPE